MADSKPTPAKKTATTSKPGATKVSPAKAAAAKDRANASAKGAASAKGPKPRAGNPYDIVFHPVVTEKTMFNMDKNNSLEFLVHVTANKPQIAAAVEELFQVKVAKVTTRITHDGKRAVVRFAEGFSAEDIGMRIGVF